MISARACKFIGRDVSIVVVGGGGSGDDCFGEEIVNQTAATAAAAVEISRNDFQLGVD